MSKTTSPFFSLGSHGTLANQLTSQKRGAATLLRRKPTPTDPKSLAQIYQRWDYQDYIASWHTLSSAEKQTWETNARPYHMTGFAYSMRDRLTNLPDLAGRWHLDNIINGKVLDSSKNTNHGTVYGASIVDGIIHKALSFDGLDDYVNTGNNPSLSLMSKLTVEAFVYPTDLSPTYNPIFEMRGDALYQILPTLWSARKQRLWIVGNMKTSADAIYTENEWQHTAFTYDSDAHELHFYRNGIPDSSNPQAANLGPIGNITHSKIGCWLEATQYFHGLIDELRIHTRALDAAEIKLHSERRYPL